MLGLADGCKQRNFNSGVKTTDPESNSGRVRIRKPWHSSLALLKIATESNDAAAIATNPITLYKKAVTKLNEETSDGSGKPFSSASLYKTQYQRLAFVHQNSCPHNNWFFLPWHRNYLAFYESELVRVLGAEAGDFGLPYWDWTANPSITPEFYEPDSPLNPVYLHKGTEFALPRTAQPGAIMDSRVVGSDNLKRILDTTDFFGFGSYPSRDTNVDDEDGRASGGLEGGPHNYVHGTLGGNMGAFLSPLDPIFWLHHCNIDRLWNFWMGDKNKSKLLPYTPTKDSVTFLTDSGDLVVSLAVLDQKNERVADYTKYWLYKKYTLNAGEGENSDILHEGTTTREVLDSTAFLIRNRETACRFGYETDVAGTAVTIAQALRNPAPKRLISSVDFNEKNRAVSEVTFAALITSTEAADVLTKFKTATDEGKDAAAFIIIAHIPVPADSEVRDALQIGLYAADADTRGKTAGRREIGTYAFFHHGMAGPHAGHSKPYITISVEITKVLKEFGSKKIPENLWVSGEFELKKGVQEPAGWKAFREGLPALLKAAQNSLELTLVVRAEA